MTRIPYAELVDMPPELLATVMQAQADLTSEQAGDRSHRYDDDDEQQLEEWT